MINIKKLYKNIDIYYINYVTVKNIHGVNPLYLVFDKIDGYVEEST